MHSTGGSLPRDTALLAVLTSPESKCGVLCTVPEFCELSRLHFQGALTRRRRPACRQYYCQLLGLQTRHSSQQRTCCPQV